MRHTLVLFSALVVLPLLACERTSYVGESCADEGCGSGLSCLADFPGGFCTRECSPAGDAAGCQEDSLCIHQQGGLMCAPVCTSDSACREGYECRGESGSSVRACRVKAHLTSPPGDTAP
jgi:hypothetical protein